MFKVFKNRFISIAILVFALIFAGCSVNETSDAPGSEAENNKAAQKEKSSGYPPAPKALANAKLKALDGDDFRIADLKGKVVLINLWATWCAPCIEEMPHFVKLQEKYGDDGLVIVGLNSDEEPEAKVRTFVEQQGLNYKIGWSTKEVVEEFINISKLPGLPQSLLLNRKGEMTGMFRGGGPDVIASMVESVEKRMAE